MADQAPDVIVADLTMGESKLAGLRLIRRLRGGRDAAGAGLYHA